MKPPPVPAVPGASDAERMSNALTKVLTVDKAALSAAEAKWAAERPKKAKRKPS